MSNNIIGIIVGVLLTLLLALYAGTSAAEGSQTPIMVIGVVIFLIVMISLKDKVWAVLIVSLFVTYTFPGPLKKFFPYEIGVLAVLPFYFFNILFRKSPLTWNGSKFLDTFVAIFALLMIALMIRFPIGLSIFEESEYINSRAYFDCLLAILFYVTLSTVNTDSKTLNKILLVTVCIQLLSILYSMSVQSYGNQDIQTERYSAFMKLGSWIVLFCMSRYSLWVMVKKPWFGFLAMMGAAGVALSGFRSSLAGLGIGYIVICLIHRRYLDILVAPILFIVSLIVIILSFGLDSLPRGIQRSVSFIPYVEVKKDIATEAENSSEWRYTMWRWAMDSRQGFIKNYVWGDGFAIEKEETIRMDIRRSGDSQDRMASAGQWHSGPISTIHRMGFVGLFVTTLMFLFSAYYAFLACRAYSSTKQSWLVIMSLIAIITAPFEWFFVFGDITQFHKFIGPMALAKLILSCARNDGLYIPVNQQKDYIPLMIKKTSLGPLAEKPKFRSSAKAV